ncbi:MAG TPA: hypothetical protein VLN59_02820 [Burkholderiales bacterium]|nr:hypothetical protein [Burkholderiales bacterium]
MSSVSQGIVEIVIWGVIATLTMISIMFVSQNLGWSRLNMPFLLGTLFTDDRRSANVLGFALYLIIGWFIAFFYYLIFDVLGGASWWVGALTGFVHGALLLTAFLPLLPYLHPRVASEYDGPDVVRKLEPPGFLALHYGYRTPMVALIAQTVYGIILGIGFS